MVEIIPFVPRGPSTADRLFNALGMGAETLAEQFVRESQRGKQKAALQKMGIDPAVLQLPKEGQAQYFKRQFAVEKPETAAQEAKRKLDEEKLLALKGQQELFGRLKKGEAPKTVPSEKPVSVSDSYRRDLEAAAAFAGQPGIPGIEGNRAKAELDRLNKQEEKEEKRGFEERKLFHTESKKFYDDLSTKAEAAETKNRALQRMIPNIKKIGKWDRIVSNVFGGTKWENLLKSKTAQEFDANTLPLLEGLRQTLGGVLSDSDIRLIMQKIVTASKDPEANQKIAQALMFENSIPIKKKQIADEIIKDNKGFRPPNFTALINEKFNEQFGNEIQNTFSDILTLPDDPANQKKIGVNQLSGEMIDVVGPDGQEYEIDRSEVDQLPEGFRLR